jgi:tight adherence protein C
VIPLQTFVLPAVATFAAFGLVLALPQRSAASHVFEDLERRPHDGGAQKLTERVIDARRLGALRAKFLAAGWGQATPSSFLVRCAACAGVAALAALALGWVLHLSLLFVVCGVVVFAVAGGHLPFSQLNGAAKQRAREISRALPDLIDTLASTVRAGLAPNAALAHAANAVEGALGDEVRATLSEVRLGRARADALRGLAARLNNEEITLMVRAMIQAERLGANLSAVLAGLADESRERRVLKAEEVAASLPVKMVLPMAFFMLPALFAMIFGAVAADYFSR